MDPRVVTYFVIIKSVFWTVVIDVYFCNFDRENFIYYRKIESVRRIFIAPENLCLYNLSFF